MILDASPCWTWLEAFAFVCGRVRTSKAACFYLFRDTFHHQTSCCSQWDPTLDLSCSALKAACVCVELKCRISRCSVGLAAGSRGARRSRLFLHSQTPCSLPGHICTTQRNPGGVGNEAGSPSGRLQRRQALQVGMTHLIAS